MCASHVAVEAVSQFASKGRGFYLLAPASASNDCGFSLFKFTLVSLNIGREDCGFSFRPVAIAQLGLIHRAEVKWLSPPYSEVGKPHWAGHVAAVSMSPVSGGESVES
jgi:hypothetical protein